MSQEMSQEDREIIAETGERLPVEIFDPSLLLQEEGALELPVFDGMKVVDKAEG